VGAIEAWLDVDALVFAARTRPDWSFVLVGPITAHAAALQSFVNVHVLGPRPYEEVPALMRAADVGIIPFRGGAFLPLTSGINPLKLAEYLAAGLPVVAARLESLEALGAPADLYEPDNAQGLVEALARALQNGPSPEAAKFLAGRTWERVFATIAAAAEQAKLDDTAAMATPSLSRPF
jgi:glycosyltransferase involved in cell wall biosynthesis